MLSSQELFIILALVILFYGRKKLPELARALGRAKREYHKEISKDDVIKIAKNLGINTEGKSYEEILKEINEKTKLRFSSEP
ncbi:MAG: twin-arginine translocase TatA/TatE family subunit [Thermoplasmata archaeon]|nr:MAG: twin-arginine translocase TatA/TatE family subunit [Thermoplasmata archaeon]RLF60535.1 MAG: twin-arginine translocase TatA/TatE family subunit [Thermoplasmata archaeon]